MRGKAYHIVRSAKEINEVKISSGKFAERAKQVSEFI